MSARAPEAEGLLSYERLLRMHNEPLCGNAGIYWMALASGVRSIALSARFRLA